MAGKGILLGDGNDLLVINGSLVIGDSEIQETGAIVEMNQGEQKFVPALGPNLVQLINSRASKFDIDQRIRIHLAKDGKEYSALKEKINTVIR